MGLLMNEAPLVVQPSLSRLVGLKESIVLQQVHYWLQRSTNIKDGYKWVYNSYPQWYEQMPLWKSETTMRTAFKNLEKKGLLITANYNKAGFDKTKWYRIDYDKLSSLEIKQRSAKNWQTMSQNLADGSARNWQTNTRDYTETTPDTLNQIKGEVPKIDIFSLRPDRSGK